MHHYQNHETKTFKNGVRQVRKVHFKGGRGYKSVSHYRRGKHVFTSKKPLKMSEISLIKIGKFIPGLFKDCGCNKKKTRKHRVI